MLTKSVTLVAGTPQVVLTGNFRIKQIVLTLTAAGSMDAYDAATTTLTQSNAAYANKARTNPYSRSKSQRDITDVTQTYTYTGVADLANTVALNATYPLQKLSSISLPAAGQQIDDNNYTVARGLVLSPITAGGTAVVWYEPAN